MMNYVKKSHRLHNIIGQILFKGPYKDNAKLFFDQACGLEKPINIQFFLSKEKPRRSFRLCYVDALILVNDKIRIVIEIEESGRYPGRIIGKFFTFMLAPYFIQKDRIYDKNEDILFLQIIDTTDSDSKQNSSKGAQWKAIENTIQKHIASCPTGIRYEYRILHGTPDDFEKLKNLLDDILIKK
jgi:hypothetical protein